MGETNNENESASFVQIPTPDTKPRDFMINTAIHFLQNPRVQKSPLSQKRAFLVKKGLTNDEIDLAIEKTSISGHSIEPRQYQDLPYVQNQIAPSPVHVHHPSIWSRLNKISTTAVVLGVALYGITQFYKLYIEPWIFGNRNKDRLAEMEAQLLEVSRSLSQLKRSVASIEESIGVQKEEFLQTMNKNVGLESIASPSFFLELKADITTVKSLLLNRHQFPEVPKVSPTIPSWQMVSETTITDEETHQGNIDKAVDEKDKQCGASEKDSGCKEVDRESPSSDSALVETQYTFLTDSFTEVMETLTIEEALNAQNDTQTVPTTVQEQ